MSIPTFILESGPWYMDLKNGAGSAGQGHPSTGDPDVTMTLSDADFTQMFAGKLDATSAFMSGKLKIKGNMGLAMKLQKFMKNMPKPAPSGGGGASGSGAGEVEATFLQIKGLLNENMVKDIGGVFAFDLKGILNLSKLEEKCTYSKTFQPVFATTTLNDKSGEIHCPFALVKLYLQTQQSRFCIFRIILISKSDPLYSSPKYLEILRRSRWGA